MNYLRIIRPLNLAFIVILISALFFGVVTAVLGKYGLTLANIWIIYPALLVSTVCIAAAGYITNDYFDTKTDQFNGKKVIVGNTISRKAAAIYFQTLYAVGIAIGVALSVFLNNYSLAFIYVVIPGILWFYSSNYKRQFLIGNLMVSFCAFTTCFLVGFASNAQLVKTYGNLIYQTPIIVEIYSWTIGFGIFSFLLTLIREIVKDMEDIYGDKEIECRTLPIVLGYNKTKVVIAVLDIATIALVFYSVFHLLPFQTDAISLKYAIIGIATPLLILLFWIGKATKTREFRQISQFIKYIMLIGTLYAGLIYYLFKLNYA